MSSDQLPSNATAWERAVADAMPVSALAESAIGTMRWIKYVSPRPSMLPFLVWEYGLGELTPYVPNLYNLIDEGVHWQRLRGTVSAVAIGLAWIGYIAEVEPAWTGRRWWNSFQLRFDALPVQDAPDLERIEGIAALSVPKRSQLRRGVFGYDVGAAQANHSRWTRALWNFESGITATPANTLWSFGRSYEFEHLLSEAEGVTIGNWIDPPVPDNVQFGDGNWIDPTDEESGDLSWGELDSLLWVDAEFLWNSGAEDQRRLALVAWFVTRPLYMRFARADGSVIGYRRCRAVRPVRAAVGGEYRFGGASYAALTSAEELYIEAMTGFGDADGEICASVSLVVGASPAAGIGAGRLWLAPDELSGGAAFAAKPVSIPLRRTVREQVKILMRF